MNRERIRKAIENGSGMCKRAAARLIRATPLFGRVSAGLQLKCLICEYDQKQLTSELGNEKESFGYLLEPTYLYLAGKPDACFPDAQALHEAWLYALGRDSTPALAQLCSDILQTGSSGAALAIWMAYLQTEHFCREQNDMEKVKVSFAVRKWYDNVHGLADGEEAVIERHPWSHCGEQVAAGMLRR